MIFRQLFDSVSGTYSYLLASRPGGEALILDPVLEKADRYCKLLQELDDGFVFVSEGQRGTVHTVAAE